MEQLLHCLLLFLGVWMLLLLLLLLIGTHKAVTLQYAVEDAVVVAAAGTTTAAAVQRGHGRCTCAGTRRVPLSLKRRRSVTQVALFS